MTLLECDFDLVDGVIVHDVVLERVLLGDVDGELAIVVSNNTYKTSLIDIGFMLFKAFRSEEPGHKQCNKSNYNTELKLDSNFRHSAQIRPH